MYISIVNLIIFGLLTISLITFIFIFVFIKAERKIKEAEASRTIYCEKTGTQGVIPSTIDLIEMRTLNLPIKKWVVNKKSKYNTIMDYKTVDTLHIPSITLEDFLITVPKIQVMFNAINDTLKKAEDYNIESIAYIKSLARVKFYKDELIKHFYTLTSRFVKNKKAYEKHLIEQSNISIGWLIETCSNIIDYYTTSKKKIQLLQKGTTVRQTLGDNLSWDSIKMDEHGKKLLKPRYVG